MSIELDPITLDFRGTDYRVFPSVNEEHHDQIDFVRLIRRCDLSEIDLNKTPKDPVDQEYLQTLTVEAWALARAQLPELEWDGGAIDGTIDYADAVSS